MPEFGGLHTSMRVSPFSRIIPSGSRRPFPRRTNKKRAAIRTPYCCAHDHLIRFRFPSSVPLQSGNIQHIQRIECKAGQTLANSDHIRHILNIDACRMLGQVLLHLFVDLGLLFVVVGLDGLLEECVVIRIVVVDEVVSAVSFRIFNSLRCCKSLQKASCRKRKPGSFCPHMYRTPRIPTQLS